MNPSLIIKTMALMAIISVNILSPQMVIAREKPEVKAAMVYNIVRFIRFPSPSKDLHICVMKNDPVANSLRALDSRTVGKSRIRVSLISDVNQLKYSCRVIYLNTAPASSIPKPKKGQVLIGSGKNFAERGGTIGLISFGGQTRFVVNDEAAKNVQVTFSAQLLQLAAKVIT